MEELRVFDDMLAKAQREKDMTGIAVAVRGVVETFLDTHQDAAATSGSPSSSSSTLEQHAPTFYASYPFLCDKLTQGELGPQEREMIDFMLSRLASFVIMKEDQETKVIMDRVSGLNKK